MTKTICVFDVNETLLDLSALDPLFDKHFGDEKLRKQWFSQMLHWSMALTITGQYRDFSSIAKTSLAAIASAQNPILADAASEEIIAAIRTLPAHPDVLPAFKRLHAAGVRLAALTNSAQDVVDAQLENAGFTPYLERIMSVDSVCRFKPDPAVYRYAAQELGVDAHYLRLIAVHDWDVTGALQAGCKAAYLSRIGATPHPLATLPDLMHSSMGELAQAIIQSDS